MINWVITVILIPFSITRFDTVMDYFRSYASAAMALLTAAPSHDTIETREDEDIG